MAKIKKTMIVDEPEKTGLYQECYEDYRQR